MTSMEVFTRASSRAARPPFCLSNNQKSQTPTIDAVGDARAPNTHYECRLLAGRVDITMISERPLCNGSTDDHASRQNDLGCPVKKLCSILLKSSF